MKHLFYYVLLCSVVHSLIQADSVTELLPLAETARLEGNYEKADQLYASILEQNPTNFNALFGKGIITFSKGDFAQAIELYRKALIQNPDCFQAHYNLGLTWLKQENLQQARHSFETVIQLNPQHTKAHLELGKLYHNSNKLNEAYDSYTKGLTIDQYHHELNVKMGELLMKMERFAEAVGYFRVALSSKPHDIATLFQLANTLNVLNETEEAITLYKKILTINPNVTSALYNLAYSLKKLGYLDEAIAIYTKIIAAKPEHTQAQFGLGLAYLTIGEFTQGWEKNEWRWKAYNEEVPSYDKPMWDGSDLNGKTIFLHAEQGLGDTYQFIRYAQILKKQGATVIVKVQKPLKTVLSLVPYIDTIITANDPLPSFDYHAPLMSLPLLCKTELDAIPDEVPYLYADETLVAHWKEKLATDNTFKVGICWQGNKNYRTSFLRQTVAAKSTKPITFAPLATVDGVTLYSLQKGDDTEEEALRSSSLAIRSFDQDYDVSSGPFMDTAAIMKNLDLVITIDTSIAHLAGGLGVPVWVMLPAPADWRWLLDRDDSPWYPTMRLFRQNYHEQWSDVVERVRTELTMMINK